MGGRVRRRMAQEGGVVAPKNRQRNNFGPPYQTCGKIRGRGLVWRWAHSRKCNRKGEGGWGG